ncbi:hypothetical protein RHMOL_Rhmol07G0192300 [Rhododendron molle]|uniref:Uncharacterized protein n=1 Tax=Rhododendron molle TaxID=49168 RepID=A0ACC0N2L2_RHOML|nr:hypothetical protein RHMOL_Rhmol07G0192300 [Rhododendron molle]
MERGDIPGDDTSLRVEATSSPIPPGDITTVGGVLETTEVSVQPALAERAVAEVAMVDGSGGGDGEGAVLARYGQGMETLGVVESRGNAETSGRSEAAVGVEERTMEGPNGGSLDQAETSPMREPRADLGKAPIVEDEPVVQPVERDIPPYLWAAAQVRGRHAI